MADSMSKGDNLSREYWKRELDGKFGSHPLHEKSRPELIFTVGLPASGKSTWAKNMATDSNFVRISRDDLRNMRGTYWIPEQENMISDWEVQLAVLAFNSGKSVILDATNLSEKRRLEFREKVMRKTNVLFLFRTKLFDTSVEECIKRDNERTVGKVGKKVILDMANRYGLKTKYPEYRYQAGLPSAIICDLDGTLAENITGRGFYDWSRVGEDAMDTTINNILDYHREHGVKIIIMSGRDGVCFDETHKWLVDHGIIFDSLLMRAEKDQRKDSIVKKELFDEYVKDKYNILFALDDRDQVVDMWRKELGIKCLQVNYGDF